MMKKNLSVLLVLLILTTSTLFLLPVAVSGQGDEYAPLGKVTLPSWLQWTKAHPGVSGINLLINNLIRLIFILASVGLFLMFLWGGVNYIFSQGDKTRTESARNIITYALIGFTIVALSFAIMRLIETFFGISIIGTTSTTSSSCVRFTGNAQDCKDEHNNDWDLVDTGADNYCCPPPRQNCDLQGCVDWTKPGVICRRDHGNACNWGSVPGSGTFTCCP